MSTAPRRTQHERREATIGKFGGLAVFNRALSDEEIAIKNKEAGEAPQWEKVEKVAESRKDYFLTVSGERAIELTLANRLCDSREQLRKELHLQDGWIDVDFRLSSIFC